MVPPDAAFVDALLAAPAGVALLARLEAEQRSDVAWYRSPGDTDPGAVERAARSVRAMSFGQLTALALEAAEGLAGPWAGDAPESLVGAYRCAPGRRPIAEAISECFGSLLHAEVDPAAQQWWHSNTPKGGWCDRPSFAGFDQLYGNGEFTFNGLWTVTDPPAETHNGLVSVWEIYPGPVSRWHLPVRPDARVWEIHQPADWIRLVQTYPKVATGPHWGWELPGPNQHDRALSELLAVPGQHAARSVVARHVLPDWAGVAADYDGVHLSWAGFLSTEGYVGELEAGAVTMLRYWRSERTLWLAEVFGDPAPLGAPGLSGQVIGVDVRADEGRQRQDLEVIAALLDR